MLSTYLAFNQYIEEVIIQFPVVAGHEVAQHGLAAVLPEAQPGQLTEAGALVVEPAALRARQQVQELIRVRGHHGCGKGWAGQTKQVSLGVNPFLE